MKSDTKTLSTEPEAKGGDGSELLSTELLECHFRDDDPDFYPNGAWRPFTAEQNENIRRHAEARRRSTGDDPFYSF